MAVVAVPFILYLVRFCSSKSCKVRGTVRVNLPMEGLTLLVITLKLAYGKVSCSATRRGATGLLPSFPHNIACCRSMHLK